jgi:hypothetical protein
MSNVDPKLAQKHPYYCNTANYYIHPYEGAVKYDSWELFLGDKTLLDLDLNLLFRWDWVESTGTLFLFFIQQRKGLFRAVEVQVVPEDEPSVREWLTPRWKRMVEIWSPISLIDSQVEDQGVCTDISSRDENCT